MAAGDALLGLRFRDRAAAVLPVPGELKTPDRAWFDREGPAVEARMERQFKWNVPSGLAGQIDESVLDLVFDGEAAKKLDGGVDFRTTWTAGWWIDQLIQEYELETLPAQARPRRAAAVKSGSTRFSTAR